MKRVKWILLFLAAAACFFYYDVKRYYVGRSFFCMEEAFWAMTPGYTISLTFRDMDMVLLIISLWATSWAITIMTVGSSSYAWTGKTA